MMGFNLSYVHDLNCEIETPYAREKVPNRNRNMENMTITMAGF